MLKSACNLIVSVDTRPQNLVRYYIETENDSSPVITCHNFLDGEKISGESANYILKQAEHISKNEADKLLYHNTELWVKPILTRREYSL